MKIAVFPGSFDPITIGHENIAQRAAEMFDKLYIAIGYNTGKQGFLDVETREKLIKEIFAGNDKIKVVSYTGLTVELCRKLNANYLVRGIRSTSDFDYEKSIAGMNRMLHSEVETIFLLSKPEYAPISSTIVREVLKSGGSVESFVPAAVSSYLNDNYQKSNS